MSYTSRSETDIPIVQPDDADDATSFGGVINGSVIGTLTNRAPERKRSKNGNIYATSLLRVGNKTVLFIRLTAFDDSMVDALKSKGDPPALPGWQ
jgi:hypothetical protein